ncbi:solute carrier family 2, facilitated glucose transporter member 3-like isoform X2 [Trichogramma pretiosum]|uniref:solute carrier family 2, facilitated glucose transporter member 3-like isoform X2 n=1 Tax=Trichogramma pretiosum TaxID=7493 RepID=UPI0006C961FA|nr:solute carrier family 2, facilitated glucose transporter member 3-like isoform X2 [Trichogramma pretiosum]
MQHVRMEEDDYGEGFIAESHPLRPTHLNVPLRESRAPSISSSVTDMDVPIYTRDTTIPLSGKLGFNPHLAFAIGAAAIGSAFQHGYNTGVVNAPEAVMKSWITDISKSRDNVTDPDAATQKSYEDHATMLWAMAVSVFCAGGMFGGCMIGWAADRFGRKGGLLINNALVVLAVIFEAIAKPTASWELFIVGRLFIGINSGLNAGLTPMYLSEISPLNLRGAVGTVYQLVITISILVAQVLGMSKLMGTAELWPYLFSLTIIPAVVQLVTLPFCPESPKYLLLSKGKDMDAQRSLTWLRGTIEVHEEMEEMRIEHETMKLTPKVTLRELFGNPSLRIPIFIAIMMMLAQQFSGINAIMFYSTSIFEMANLTGDKAQNATIGVGVVNVLMTFVSMILVEKAGRKTLLLIGFFGMTIVTTLLAICLIFRDYEACSIMAVVLVIVYIILFASGPGSIPWFLVSELFNQSARPTASSVAIAINWAANFLVGIGFPPVKALMDSSVFFVFAGLQCFFTLFIWFKVPETRNKSIEEISSMFRQRTYQ